jgi:ABC-type dipeptide/oligopeptide/nickel transport system ATPase component
VTIPLLEVDNLSIGYRTAHGIQLAVDGVSFRVDRGGSLGLVGESGCGKTTIGMGLMGLLASNATIVSGQVRFEGEDLTAASDHRMRQIRWRRISMIFQSAMNALNPVHRVQDQIAEAIITHEPELSSHAVAHRARSLFELVKIPENRLQALSAPVFRRHAPTGDHCHGPGLQSVVDHRRRAYHCPGRHCPEPDLKRHRHLSKGDEHRHDFHFS